MIRAAGLPVPHGFFGRDAGDCGLGNAQPDAAAKRRAAVAAVLPGAPLATAYQIHSPTAVIVTQAVPDDQRPRADALVTATPGLILGIVTADCAPILLADLHAGVRGAVAGVTDQAIACLLYTSPSPRDS